MGRDPFSPKSIAETDQAISSMADLWRSLYDSLVSKGFSNDEALQILIAHVSKPYLEFVPPAEHEDD